MPYEPPPEGFQGSTEVSHHAETTLLTLTEVHSIFKTSQEHAVIHFIRHSVSFCRIKMNAWLVSKFSDIQEFKCHFKNFVLYLA